jgi:hypothetical protein
MAENQETVEQPQQVEATPHSDEEILSEARAVSGTLSRQPELRQESSMDQFIDRALEGKADIEVLGKLLEYRRQEKADRARELAAQALVLFQSICPQIVKTGHRDDTKHKNKGGEFGTTVYDYPQWDTARAQIGPALTQCQLGITHTILRNDPNWIEVEAVLTHGPSAFQWRTSLGGPPDTSGGKNLLQARKSTVTYLKTATAFTLLGLTCRGEVDMTDDGEGGAPANKAEAEKPASAALLDPDVGAARRKFGAVCCRKVGKPAIRPDVLETLLAEAQRLSGKQGITEAADWLQKNGEIRQAEGKWQIVPTRQG